MGRLAVLGPGLLGGSVALAARARGISREVTLWARRAEAIEELQQAGVADVASSELSKVLSGAELVVIATPVGAVRGLFEEVLRIVPAGAVATDLCSVKEAVEVATDAAFKAVGRDDVSFVGAHPMAGSDRTGFAHASADLFDGAACALTPGAHSTQESIRLVDGFWSALGCRTVQLEAAQHDQYVARVSHAPHLAASALVNAALGDSPDAAILAGPGFRDSTRIASSSPEMWTEIVAENREAVADALVAYIDELGELLAKLRDMDNGGVRESLADARARRAKLYPDAGDPEHELDH